MGQSYRTLSISPIILIYYMVLYIHGQSNHGIYIFYRGGKKAFIPHTMHKRVSTFLPWQYSITHHIVTINHSQCLGHDKHHLLHLQLIKYAEFSS